MKQTIQATSRGTISVQPYDDGVAKGINVYLNEEIIAAVDVYEKEQENEIPEVRVLVYPTPETEEPEFITISD